MLTLLNQHSAALPRSRITASKDLLFSEPMDSQCLIRLGIRSHARPVEALKTFHLVRNLTSDAEIMVYVRKDQEATSLYCIFAIFTIFADFRIPYPFRKVSQFEQFSYIFAMFVLFPTFDSAVILIFSN